MATSLDSRFSPILSAVRSSSSRVPMADGSVRFLKSTTEFPPSIRQTYPLGVDLIVIGESPKTGWSPADKFASNGIVVVLIGLLLPAVQAARESARRRTSHSVGPDLHGLLSLKSALRPGGKVFVIDSDGSMLPFIA